jgi:hypothetical protein
MTRLEDEMPEPKPAPNDQRANVKNPNNPAHEADRANRQAQKPTNSPPAPKPKK